jgi:hypothetical protein
MSDIASRQLPTISFTHCQRRKTARKNSFFSCGRGGSWFNGRIRTEQTYEASGGMASRGGFG